MHYNNFYIEKNQYIDNKDLENARILYTPIIGANPIALYHYLIDESNLADNPRKVFLFTEIRDALNCDEEALMEAKEKLEAVGLIRYYESTLFKNGIFSINKPLNINQYQKSILAKQLIKKIGEQKYQKILFAFSYHTFDKSEYKNRSKKYTDFFDVSQELRINIEKIHEDVNQSMLVKNARTILYESKPADYIKYLTSRIISPTQQKLVETLVNLGFSYPQINLFCEFSFKVNGEIVSTYIEKIAQDYAKRNIFSTQAVESELNYAYQIKKQSKDNQKEKFVNLKSEDITEVFDKYGLEGWND